MPYDFDYSGLVDAPYAVPPEGFGIRTVSVRGVYQGYCRHNAQALAAAADFRARRPAIEALFGQIPGMSERTRAKALAYLAGFFEQIATDETVQAKVLKTCLRLGGGRCGRLPAAIGATGVAGGMADRDRPCSASCPARSPYSVAHSSRKHS